MHNTPEAVRQYYEEWTDKYLEDFGLYFQANQAKNPVDIIKNLTRVIPIHQGMNVLDAGCGVGGPAISLAKLRKVNIEALTISDTQIKYAQENIQKAWWLKGKINLTRGDFHQLEEYYQPDQFDLVYFMESLVHSHDPDAVIKSVKKVLKPSGYLYIKDLFKGPENPQDPEMTNYPVAAIDSQFCLKIQEVGTIINILTRNGFRIEACRVPNFESDFSKGNLFTARHLFKLRNDRTGPWVDEGLIFLHWLEIVATKHY